MTTERPDVVEAPSPGPDLVPGTPSTTGRRSLLPAVAIGVTVLMWASAFVGIRALGQSFTPGGLSLGRLAVGSAALGILVLARRPTWPPRSDWPRLIAIGVLWFGVYNVALNAAEQRIDAGTAAMLVNIAPVLLAVLAGLRLGEGFPRPLIIGSAIGFSGVVVIGVATSSGARADVWGAALCVLAAVAYAVAVVAQKPILERTSGLLVTWIACTVGVVVTLPFTGQLLDGLRAADGGDVGTLLYLGLGPTAIAFTTWAYALKRTSAGRLGATTYLVPPIAVGLGWLLLDEVPPFLALAGGLLCLVGVAVTRQGAAVVRGTASRRIASRTAARR